MSIQRQVAVLAALAVAVGGLWFSGLPQALLASLEGAAGGGTAGGGGAAAQRTRPKVLVSPVRFDSAVSRVEAVGTAEAIRSVTLSPEASGIVREVAFTAGQRVKGGQVLLRLDDEEAGLALEEARVRLADAERTLARLNRLSRTGAVSAAQHDDARSALALARLQVLRGELTLRQRAVVAPFAGVLGIAEVDAGDRVTPGMAVVNLDDRSVLTVDFDVPEVYAAGVALGNAVEATPWARPEQRVRGTVDAISSRVHPQSRTLRVRARIPNTEDDYRPGMAFSVRLDLEGGQFPAVPSLAVLWERNSAYLWRLQGDTVERLEVKVLKRSEAWVLLEAPLAPGDLIVFEGVQALRPGIAVDATRESPPGAARGRREQ